ncbi:heterokaryon incompatibility protein-domain-containing protein [Scleroderma yunnanense]
MRLINVEAFLGREELIRERKQVDSRTKVLELRDDEFANYAILSHRWIDQEVSYDEMTELAKMEEEARDEIRQRSGYQKILDSCEQAKKDEYKWLWVDTCCINKESSAELSEAINSMYRWYENSKVCYAYLHDVTGESFPTKPDKRMYPNCNGWPEWFSRGWTLQEMIAPNAVRFFNKYWQPIGDKRTHAEPLSNITRVPQRVLRDGFSFNHPCVAQIMSWAADRRTTRVEDKAYSLMGLLDVNMPMLYGEGKKAFHRLQLEIIRTSDDQSIFAWGSDGENWRTGSILADDPSFFQDCAQMELMEPHEFIQHVNEYIPEELRSMIEADRFGSFPVSNRGIQIWMLVRPLRGSDSVIEARLPCCASSSGAPVSINLALWKSNYYRYFTPVWKGFPTEGTLQFRQLYLRYQDIPHRNVTFKIDDSAITRNGFTYCGTYPWEPRENTVTLTRTNFLYVKIYSNSESNCRFAVGFGLCFGQGWIHFVYQEHACTNYGYSQWEDYAEGEYKKMLVRGPEHARSMAEVRSRGERYGHLWFKYNCLPGRTGWSVRTSYIVWESSKNWGVRIDAFQDPGIRHRSDEWADLTNFDVEGTDDPNCDMRCLMIRDRLKEQNRYGLCVDGLPMEFSLAPNTRIELGDYGSFIGPNAFHREGNVFADIKSLAPELDVAPRQHKIYAKDSRDDGYVTAHSSTSSGSGDSVVLYEPIGLSLPRNQHFNSLAFLSTQLTNRYLVTRVIECATEHSSKSSAQSESNHRTRSYRPITSDTSSHIVTPLCTMEKPFVWYLDESASSALVEFPNNKLRTETNDGRRRGKRFFGRSL